jgi:hypothetical protein
MRQHEGRLIPHVQVAPELQCRDAFDRVHEDGDRCQVVADRKLAAGEDGSAGDAELMLAPLAFPDAPGAVRVDRRAFAARAERRAAVVCKPDGDEASVSLIVSQPHDRFHGKRSRPC